MEAVLLLADVELLAGVALAAVALLEAFADPFEGVAEEFLVELELDFEVELVLFEEFAFIV